MENEEKQKYIIINIHGLDHWSFKPWLIGKTVTLCNDNEIQRSLFGFEFVKGWFHVENPPEDIENFPADMNIFFIGVQLQELEENEKKSGVMVVAQ